MFCGTCIDPCLLVMKRSMFIFKLILASSVVVVVRLVIKILIPSLGMLQVTNRTYLATLMCIHTAVCLNFL